MGRFHVLMLNIGVLWLSFSVAENVLFVGNSYTYVNDLDQVFAALWRSSTYSSIQTSRFANGGWQYWDQMTAAENSTTDLYHLLWTSGIQWDYIVWQDQSIVPSCVYGLTDLQKGYYSDSTYAIGQLNTMARARNPVAQSILYQTWGRQYGWTSSWLNFTDYSSMQDALTLGYTRYRDFVYSNMSSNNTLPNNTVTIAPAGEVWRQVHLDGASAVVPFASLYLSDGSHPTIYGTYLVACTMWSTITHFSPVGLGYVPPGMNITEAQYIQATTHNVLTQVIGLPLAPPPTPVPTTPPPTTSGPPTTTAAVTSTQPLPSDNLSSMAPVLTPVPTSAILPTNPSSRVSTTQSSNTIASTQTAPTPASSTPTDTLGTFAPRPTQALPPTPRPTQPTTTVTGASDNNSSTSRVSTTVIIALVVVVVVVLVVLVVIIVVSVVCYKKWKQDQPRSRRDTSYDANSLYTLPSPRGT